MQSFSLKRDSNRSILSELRKKGHTQKDFLKQYPARIPSSGSIVAMTTQHLTVDETPLLYIDKEGAFVHGDYFDDLNSCSVMQLSSQRHVVIGTLRKAIPWMTLLRFMIEADIICTYVHLESEMTITPISENRADIQGTHTFFTNEENIEPFSFVIEKDHTQTIHCLYT
jgi:hypothetical protein